jgi:hypothetical protein
MWSSDQITIDIIEVDRTGGPPILEVQIVTPAGTIYLVGAPQINGRVLVIDNVHIGGLHRGACGRAGLNAIGRKFLEVADVDEIIIQGGSRTTGANPGRPPKEIRFPSN